MDRAGVFLGVDGLLLDVGAMRTSLTTYLLSAFGGVCGALFLPETITVRLLIGLALIVLRVVVVNGHIRQPRAASGHAAAARLPVCPILRTEARAAPGGQSRGGTRRLTRRVP